MRLGVPFFESLKEPVPSGLWLKEDDGSYADKGERPQHQIDVIHRPNIYPQAKSLLQNIDVKTHKNYKKNNTYIFPIILTVSENGVPPTHKSSGTIGSVNSNSFSTAVSNKLSERPHRYVLGPKGDGLTQRSERKLTIQSDLFLSPDWIRNVQDRIRKLRSFAAEDGVVVSEESFSDALGFAKRLPRSVEVQPGTFLLDNGNFRFLWNARRQQIGLQFLGNGLIQYVLFVKDGERISTIMGQASEALAMEIIWKNGPTILFAEK